MRPGVSENAGSECETELEFSSGVKMVLVSIKLLLLIPNVVFIVYIVYLARYELEHWYYFPFAAQFWWGIIILFLLGVVELCVAAAVIRRSIDQGKTKYVPKSETSCRRCGDT